MSFLEVCKRLGIEQHAEAIFNANKYGELFHIWQYYDIYEICGDCKDWFGPWFELVIEQNEEKTNFIYRHVLAILQNHLEHIREREKQEVSDTKPNKKY